MTTYYFLRSDGFYEKRETDDPMFVVPVGWTTITQAQYDAAIANIEATLAANAAAADATECAQRKADFNALVAAGIPGNTAHRLSGWVNGSC